MITPKKPKPIAEWHQFRSSWGTMTIAAHDKAIVLLSFSKLGQSRLENELHKIGYAAQKGNNRLGQKAAEELDEYLSGKRRKFSLPVELHGTDFQKRVWYELSRIPFGQVVSYGELAAIAGYPNAGRAVGSAMAKNRISILIPCHRVIAAKARLGGFGGRPSLKRKLLELEGVSFVI